jgi:hypothetical protein
VDIGRRWYSLEGLSPLLLCAYSNVADEIVYILLHLLLNLASKLINRNSKITIPSLKAIAAQVQQIAPELARISAALVQNGRLGMKGIEQKMYF